MTADDDSDVLVTDLGVYGPGAGRFAGHDGDDVVVREVRDGSPAVVEDGAARDATLDALDARFEPQDGYVEFSPGTTVRHGEVESKLRPWVEDDEFAVDRIDVGRHDPGPADREEGSSGREAGSPDRSPPAERYDLAPDERGDPAATGRTGTDDTRPDPVTTADLLPGSRSPDELVEAFGPGGRSRAPATGREGGWSTSSTSARRYSTGTTGRSARSPRGSDAAPSTRAWGGRDDTVRVRRTGRTSAGPCRIAGLIGR